MEDQAQKSLRFWHLAAAALLFCLLFFLSYPHYKYFVDPDAVAYLTMAKRAAEGDTWRLVNALWSPLHPAMVTVGIKSGIDALLAAQLTNGLACLLVLICTYGLFRRAKLSAATGFPLLLCLSIFLVYALYKQLFCDIWQTGFLLTGLLLITGNGFVRKPFHWLCYALLAVLATYSKVYSFYFLLLHLPLSLYFISKKEGIKFPWRPYVSIIALQILLLAPWGFLMHKKYGHWNLSMSGALNTSWTLVGHKSPADSISALIPPPYSNSPYTWEDPFLAEGKLHGRFESVAMIKSQIGHSILACMQAVEALCQMSAFLLPALLIAFFLFWKKNEKENVHQKIWFLAAGIMPIGYLLLHVEARYLWLLLPIGMILGAQLIERIRPFLNKKSWLLVCWFFAFSFIVWPIHDLKALFHVGNDVRDEALILKKNGISGSFSSNDNPSRSGLLAYWMDERFYTPISPDISSRDLQADLNKYRVNYFFEYLKKPTLATSKTSTDSLAGKELQLSEISNLRIYALEPQ
jgi:hypothetical protein